MGEVGEKAKRSQSSEREGAARDCSLAAMEQYRDLSTRGVRCIAPHTTHAHLHRNWRNLNEACRLVSSIVPVLLSYFWYCATGCMMSPTGNTGLDVLLLSLPVAL